MSCIQTGDLMLQLSKETVLKMGNNKNNLSEDVVLKDNSIYQMLNTTSFSNITNNDIQNISQIQSFDFASFENKPQIAIQPSLYNQKLNEELTKENFEDSKISESHYTQSENDNRMRTQMNDRDNKFDRASQNELGLVSMIIRYLIKFNLYRLQN